MRRYKYLKSKSRKNKFGLFKLLLIISITFLFLVFCFVYYKISSLEKFIFVNNDDGDAQIIIVDPKKDKVTKILIDKDILVDSSRNFGEYKLGSLWILGEKERYQGKLVTETIVKNFGIPVYLWKNNEVDNLNLFQKIKVRTLKDNGREYDYTLSSKSPKDSILINFVYPYLESNLPKVRIEDLTGEQDVAESISKVIEVLGFKTVDYQKGFDEKLDCEVVGKNKGYNEMVSKVFGCKASLDTNQSIDLEIRVGKAFADRF